MAEISSTALRTKFNFTIEPLPPLRLLLLLKPPELPALQGQQVLLEHKDSPAQSVRRGHRGYKARPAPPAQPDRQEQPAPLDLLEPMGRTGLDSTSVAFSMRALRTLATTL